MNFPLINIDSSLNALADHEITGRIIDASVSQAIREAEFVAEQEALERE